MDRTIVTIARITALAGLCAATVACAKPPADPVAEAPVVAVAPEPAPMMAAAPPGIPLAAPVVLAIRAGAAVGAATLDADAEAPLSAADVLTVPERGMAVVKWAEGPRAESLGAELMLLGAADVRQLGVSQRSGTARYSIPAADADGAISLAVETSRATVRALAGPADVIVSLDPGASPPQDASNASDNAAANATLWVIVIDGAIEVTADQSVASAAGAAAPLKAVVAAGQAIAVSASTVPPAAMPVDLSGIETWYGGLVAGDGPPSATTAAYRCQVTAPQAVLREEPAASAKAVAKSVALAAGAIIDVRGRSADGTWLQAFLAATELTGWVPAADLTCIAPPDVLAVVDPATVHNVDRTALAAKVPATASFIQDKTEIAPGGCVKLNWDVVAGTAVTFDGQPVPGKGFKVMCPEATTSYAVAWMDESGRPQTRRLTVTVSAALAVAAAAAGNDPTGGASGSGGATGGAVPAGNPTATPCVGPECEVTVPPPPATATRRPRPTAPPVQPTDVPAPDPTDAPPPPVVPTDPPRPDPTEEPSDPTDTPLPPDPTASPTPDPSGTPPPPATETPEPTGTPTPEPTPTP